MTEKIQHNLVPEEQNDKLAVWLFLGGEVVLFTVLILTFVLARIQHGNSYHTFREHINVPLVGLNTFVLVASSYLVVRGLEAIRHDNQSGLRNNLLGVLILGALFLAGQAYEWSELFKAGISVNNTFGAPFFTVTGIHGAHVLIGLAIGAFVLVNALDNAYSSRNFLGVESFGLYWHFVDVVWIILFTLIYLY
jgi:heme/copper-type cytochrome/quinol oxidase subunit 3